MYAILTEEYFYDNSNQKCFYTNFKEYHLEEFRERIKTLDISGVSFRAFRVTPISVSIDITINEIK